MNANKGHSRVRNERARDHRIQYDEVAAVFDEIADLLDPSDIGADLAAQSVQLLRNGRDHVLIDLRRKFAQGALELLRSPRFGPKRVRALTWALLVDNVPALPRALR
jgi:DNA polymerase/3'-5' exonuclease PolX